MAEVALTVHSPEVTQASYELRPAVTLRATLQSLPQSSELPAPPALSLLGCQPACHHLCRQWWPEHLKASLRLNRLRGQGLQLPAPLTDGSGVRSPPAGTGPTSPWVCGFGKVSTFPPPSLGLPVSEVGTITPLGLKVHSG